MHQNIIWSKKKKIPQRNWNLIQLSLEKAMERVTDKEKAKLRNFGKSSEQCCKEKPCDAFGKICLDVSFWDSSLPHLWVLLETVFIPALSGWGYFVQFTRWTGPGGGEILIFNFLLLLGWFSLRLTTVKLG